jgi:hypothetical protein
MLKDSEKATHNNGINFDCVKKIGSKKGKRNLH